MLLTFSEKVLIVCLGYMVQDLGTGFSLYRISGRTCQFSLDLIQVQDFRSRVWMPGFKFIILSLQSGMNPASLVFYIFSKFRILGFLFMVCLR